MTSPPSALIHQGLNSAPPALPALSGLLLAAATIGPDSSRARHDIQLLCDRVWARVRVAQYLFA